MQTNCSGLVHYFRKRKVDGEGDGSNREGNCDCMHMHSGRANDGGKGEGGIGQVVKPPHDFLTRETSPRGESSAPCTFSITRLKCTRFSVHGQQSDTSVHVCTPINSPLISVVWATYAIGRLITGYRVSITTRNIFSRFVITIITSRRT